MPDVSVTFDGAGVVTEPYMSQEEMRSFLADPADPNLWYMLVCVDCDPANPPPPLKCETAKDRLEWAIGHQEALGHRDMRFFEKPRT